MAPDKELARIRQDLTLTEIDRRVGSLESRARKSDKDILHNRVLVWATVGILTISLAFAFGITFNAVKLDRLLHIECERSEKGAELRADLITALTQHVALPPKASPDLRKTVQDRNRQLDKLRRELTTTGNKIPKVHC